MPDAIRPLVVALALGAASVPPAGASAQDIRELERRVDAAVAQGAVVAAALSAYRQRIAASPERGFRDTLVILDGGYRIVTDRELLPIVRDAGALVESFVRQRAGEQRALLRGTVFAVWTDSARRAEQGLILSPRVNGRETNEQYVFASATALARALEEHAQGLLGTSGKPIFGKWLSGGLPIDTATNSDWRGLRLDLVSSVATVARRCHAGGLLACKMVLGLVDAPDPATAFYDSASRWRIVEGQRHRTRLDHRGAAACLAGRDAECIRLLRTDPDLRGWLSPAGWWLGRKLLVQQSFAMGGQGALARLRDSKDTPAEALSAIAGSPIDSVVAQWQRHAHDGGIESEIATPVVVLTALVWIIVMGALSLRSPRWR